MGYIKHHAIVVTCWNDKHIEQAHALAVENELRPTEITPSAVNGQRSFLIPPDGSKEGWEESDNGNDRRDAWIKTMEHLADKNYCDWCEVRFGGDDYAATVERRSL